MVNGAVTQKRSLEEGPNSPETHDAAEPDQSSKRICTGSPLHASAKVATPTPLADEPDQSKVVIGMPAATQANGSDFNVIPCFEGISGQRNNAVPTSKAQTAVAISQTGSNAAQAAAQAAAVLHTASAGRYIVQPVKQERRAAMQVPAEAATGHARSTKHIGLACEGVKEGEMEGDASQEQSLKEIEQQVLTS